jgi:uncharacterized membrane protein
MLRMAANQGLLAANGGDLPVRVVEADAVTHDNVVAGVFDGRRPSRKKKPENAMNEAITERQAVDTNMAKVIYILYLIGLIAGVTAIVGVVMAYVYKDNAPDWLRTHYELQIRTFWMALLYAVISGVLSLILIGFLLFLVLAIWWIVRCVKGLKYLDQRTAYPDHLGWFF